MTDYNQNGTTLGSSGTIYANGSVTNNDPSTWLADNDWKSIMAAICGYSSGYEDPTITATLADPGQMRTVAEVLYDAQQALSETAQNLVSLIQELTGSSGSWYGSWQGDAAQAAQDSITTFAKQIQLNADTLFTGQNGQEIAQQLADNAVNLQNAQNDVKEIDSYYATEAANNGVGKSSNGTVPVSQDQVIVQMMTRDMYTVLQNLISAYNPTIDNVPSSLPGVSSPAINSSGSLDGNPPGATDPGDVTPPDLSGLGSSLGNGLGGLGSSLSDGLGGLGSGLGNNLDGLAQFPGDTGVGSGTGSGTGSDLSQFPGDTGVGTGSGLAQSPGDTGLGTDTGGTLPPFTGNTGVGSGGTGDLPGTSDLSGENPSTWGDSPGTGISDLGTGGTGDLSGLGGLGSGGAGGTGDLSGLGNLGTGGTGGTGGLSQFPGSTSTESGLPSSSLTGDGLGSLPNSLESSGTGGTSPGTGLGSSAGGMPYMPGMGGMGGLGGAGAGDNRSDASGLLDSQGAPWEGSANLGGGEVGGAGTDAGGAGLDLPTEVGGTGGTDAGGAGLDLSSEASPSTASGLGAADGMPYMPGMGGMGGLGGAGAGDNRSDASGLLEAESAPWEGQAGAGDEELAAGAAEGGPGLDLPAESVAPSPEESAREAAADGISAEGMPHPPGVASAAPGSAEKRSDAAGLPGLESLVWDEGATGGDPVVLGAPEDAADAEPSAATSSTSSTVDSAGFVAADSTSVPVTVDDTGATAETDGGNHLDFANLLSAKASGWVPATEDAATPVAEEAVASATAEAATAAVASSSVGETASPQLQQAGPQQNRPQDRVTPSRRAKANEDTSAWDLAGAAFAPVLWQVPGRGTDAGSEPAEVATEFAVDGNPLLTTWRPDRSGTASRTVRSMADLRCVDGPAEPEEQPEETAEPAEQDESEQPPKGIADLLVQDENTWGSWPYHEASDVF